MTRGCVVVTGAASGIGLATAARLAAEGWSVVAADRDAEALERLRAAIPGANDGMLRLAPLDITDAEAVGRFAQALLAAPDRLVGLVNSAGIASNARFTETTAELFRTIYDVNVVGAFALSQALAPIMAASGGGAIVHIASVSGMVGSLGRSAYGASKGALIALTRIMAVELADDKIRVNAVAPGPIETPMARAFHSEQTRAEWRRTVPMRRYGAPEEVAAAIAFLLDGERSAYITGQVLAVDGGFTIAGLMN